MDCNCKNICESFDNCILEFNGSGTSSGDFYVSGGSSPEIKFLNSSFGLKAPILVKDTNVSGYVEGSYSVINIYGEYFEEGVLESGDGTTFTHKGVIDILGNNTKAFLVTTFGSSPIMSNTGSQVIVSDTIADAAGKTNIKYKIIPSFSIARTSNRELVDVTSLTSIVVRNSDGGRKENCCKLNPLISCCDDRKYLFEGGGKFVPSRGIGKDGKTYFYKETTAAQPNYHCDRSIKNSSDLSRVDKLRWGLVDPPPRCVDYCTPSTYRYVPPPPKKYAKLNGLVALKIGVLTTSFERLKDAKIKVIDMKTNNLEQEFNTNSSGQYSGCILCGCKKLEISSKGVCNKIIKCNLNVSGGYSYRQDGIFQITGCYPESLLPFQEQYCFVPLKVSSTEEAYGVLTQPIVSESTWDILTPQSNLTPTTFPTYPEIPSERRSPVLGIVVNVTKSKLYFYSTDKALKSGKNYRVKVNTVENIPGGVTFTATTGLSKAGTSPETLVEYDKVDLSPVFQPRFDEIVKIFQRKEALSFLIYEDRGVGP